MQSVTFPSGTTDYIFIQNGKPGKNSFEEVLSSYNKQHIVIITNDHVAKLYAGLFKGYKMLVVPASESGKDLHTIEALSKQLLQLDATRNTLLVGVGGG